MRNAIRADEWWVFKMAPLLAVAYAEVILHGLSPVDALPLIGGMLVSGGFLAAFGHVVNDAFDVTADGAAGKENRLAHVPIWVRVGGSTVLLVGAFVPWVFLPASPAALGLLALNAVLLLAYSAPPIRLKERGLGGLLADAGYAHVVPVVFVATLFGGLTPPDWAGATWTVGLIAWAMSFGLRGILLHQIWDAEADVTAGVSTFVTTHGILAARRLIQTSVFPVEVGALAVMGIGLAAMTPGSAAFLGVLGVLAYVLTVLDARPRRGRDPAPEDPTTHVPLVLFYAVWPPLVFGTQLAARDPLFILLFVLPIVLFREAVVREGRNALAWALHALRILTARAPASPPTPTHS